MDNPWSWSHQHEARLWIDIGHGDAQAAPSRDHHRDWTLYVDDVTLPLSQADRHGRGVFLWYGDGIQNLFADWTPSTTYRIGIMETPFADQPQAVVPDVPGLDRVYGFGGDTITVRWWTPHGDGGSAITGYKIQWGETAGRASEPSGQGEEAPPEGLGGCQLLAQADARCPAGQIVGHHLDGQPGGVGGEAARGEMVEPHAVLEVADGVLDLGVAAMVGLQVQGLPLSVGDESVIAVGGKDGQLGAVRGSPPIAFAT